MARPDVRELQAVRELHDRFAPVTLSGERLLPVPDPLLPLFPFGGLPKGQVLGVEGTASWSLALALAGAAIGASGWAAVFGIDELGLVAAAELGLSLDRVLVVETVEPSLQTTVVATLIDAVDLVLLPGSLPIGRRDARRLEARARERETVLLHLDGGRRWPLPLDLTLTTSSEHWEGIGPGHGHLRCRRLEVEAVGRRSSARRRRTALLLPGPDGGLAPAEPLAPLEPATRPGDDDGTAAAALARVG